jgi:hypothetical protein
MSSVDNWSAGLSVMVDELEPRDATAVAFEMIERALTVDFPALLRFVDRPALAARFAALIVRDVAGLIDAAATVDDALIDVRERTDWKAVDSAAAAALHQAQSALSLTRRVMLWLVEHVRGPRDGASHEMKAREVANMAARLPIWTCLRLDMAEQRVHELPDTAPRAQAALDGVRSAIHQRRNRVSPPAGSADGG